MVIECVGKPDPRALHNGETSGVDGRQFVQLGAAKVLPRLFQIAQFASENVHSRALLNRFLPRKCHLPVGVPVQKREGLDASISI